MADLCKAIQSGDYATAQKMHYEIYKVCDGNVVVYDYLLRRAFHVYVCTYVCMLVRMCVRMCVCVYVCVRMCVCMRIKSCSIYCKMYVETRVCTCVYARMYGSVLS